MIGTTSFQHIFPILGFAALGLLIAMGATLWLGSVAIGYLQRGRILATVAYCLVWSVAWARVIVRWVL